MASASAVPSTTTSVQVLRGSCANSRRTLKARRRRILRVLATRKRSEGRSKKKKKKKSKDESLRLHLRLFLHLSSLQ